MDGRLTITEVANFLGVTPRTIMRWEKFGKVKKPKRDWRGWRFYSREDLEEIKKFYESSYEYGQVRGSLSSLAKTALITALALLASVSFCVSSEAAPDSNVTAKGAIMETKTKVEIDLNQLPVVATAPATANDSVTYTLGPEDVIDIEVRRHPEFSGKYVLNSEGRIEYKFVGDIVVAGLTKKEVKERLTEILSEYVVSPEIDVSIAAYLSKTFYVVGEVNKPGKFYMRGNTVSVMEALIQSGLPTFGAAMRRCRLIRPDDKGRNNYVDVDVYKLLYEGNLKCNLVMRPGDVLYVPATIIAKIIHVISPVTTAVSDTAGAAAPIAGLAAAAAL
jgi:polysaccharide export outer membrane protein